LRHLVNIWRSGRTSNSMFDFASQQRNVSNFSLISNAEKTQCSALAKLANEK